MIENLTKTKRHQRDLFKSRKIDQHDLSFSVVGSKQRMRRSTVHEGTIPVDNFSRLSSQLRSVIIDDELHYIFECGTKGRPRRPIGME
jgi:hypothetical protein